MLVMFRLERVYSQAGRKIVDLTGLGQRKNLTQRVLAAHQLGAEEAGGELLKLVLDDCRVVVDKVRRLLGGDN